MSQNRDHSPVRASFKLDHSSSIPSNQLPFLVFLINVVPFLLVFGRIVAIIVRLRAVPVRVFRLDIIVHSVHLVVVKQDVAVVVAISLLLGRRWCRVRVRVLGY